MDLRTKLRAMLPPWLRLGQKQATGSDSGVNWVGNPDTRQIIWLGDNARPDADVLTRQIALATSAYCYTATEYRWRTISEPPLAVYDETDDGAEEVASHPLDVLLQEPSPDYDMGELMALTEAYVLISGAALWVKARSEENAGEARGLIPFSGDQFETKAADGRIYGRFLVDTDKGRKEYLPEDVVFFREVNPGSWRTNLSKLDVALNILDLGHQINRTVRNFMRKAMFPGGVISPHQDWNPDPDEFDQYTDQIKAWHSGPANAGDPLVLLGGTTFSGASLRLKDLLPDELLDRIEATVASVYGIPPVVLGWLVGLKNSPWSQMSEARKMTYEDTISPRWRFYEKAMTRQMLDPRERAVDRKILFDTSDVLALQADTDARADTAAKMRDEWTLNERRTYTGQEPLDDERGEEIGVSSGAGAGPFGGDDSGTMGAPGPTDKKRQIDELKLRWLLFDANCKAAESTWSREIFKELDKQGAAIAALARKYLKEEKAATEESTTIFLGKVENYLGDVGTPDLLKVSYPLVHSTAEAGVKDAARQVGLSFDILQEGLEGYSQTEAAWLATEMERTTWKAVQNAIQKGLDGGETVNALSKRLRDLPAFDRARAQLTARTETTRAWNGAQRGQMSKYQADTGHQVEKSWLSVKDGQEREDHGLQDNGQWYPIDSVFDIVGLEAPGEPNCRCTLIYRIVEA